MVTAKVLAQEINRIYSRFLDKENPKLDDREVLLYISQVVNQMFKLEKEARTDVPGTAIATYEEKKQKDDTYYVNLPVSPISLPKEQGVHRVYPSGCPWKPFIPIRTGDFDIVQGTPTQYIEGQTGYYMDGMKLRFTKNVSDDIVLKLIVNDPSHDPNSPLPVPKDMEILVIQGVFNILGFGQISQAELNSKHEQAINNERNR